MQIVKKFLGISFVLIFSLFFFAGPTSAVSSYDLFAGQDNDIGEVEVWNDSETLYLNYITDGDWCMDETHLHVTSDYEEFTLAAEKNPVPGQFEYKMEYDSCVNNYKYEIPLNDWEIEDELFVAAHAAVGEESAWAGTNSFSDKGNWATYFTYVIEEVKYGEFGYNYSDGLFNGRYCDYDRQLGGEHCDINLGMEWNEALLSSEDKDEDGELDRHYGYDSYIGSEAWFTNHQMGEYAQEYFYQMISFTAESAVEDYDLQGWSDGMDTNGDGNKDARFLMGPGDGCKDEDRTALFTMNSGENEVAIISLTHLDSSNNDDFEVYIFNGTNYELIGSYQAEGTGNWETTKFYFNSRQGEITFKLKATGEITEECSDSGQVGFRQAALWEEKSCVLDKYIKVEALPEDAYSKNGIWYTEDGNSFGRKILEGDFLGFEWREQFAIVEEERGENDSCKDVFDLPYIDPKEPDFTPEP